VGSNPVRSDHTFTNHTAWKNERDYSRGSVDAVNSPRSSNQEIGGRQGEKSNISQKRMQEGYSTEKNRIGSIESEKCHRSSRAGGSITQKKKHRGKVGTEEKQKIIPARKKYGRRQKERSAQTSMVTRTFSRLKKCQNQLPGRPKPGKKGLQKEQSTIRKNS